MTEEQIQNEKEKKREKERTKKAHIYTHTELNKTNRNRKENETRDKKRTKLRKVKVLNWNLIELNQAERKTYRELRKNYRFVTTYFPGSLATRPLYVPQPFSLFKSSDCNPSVVVHQANAFNTYANNSSTQANLYRHHTVYSHSYAWNSLTNPNLYPNQYTFYPITTTTQPPPLLPLPPTPALSTIATPSTNPNVSHPLNPTHHNNSNYCVHDQQYVNLRIKIKPNTVEKSTREAIVVASNEKTSAAHCATDIQINSRQLLTDSPIATQAAIVTSVASTTATSNHQSIYDYLLNNPSANLFTDSGISQFVQLCILTNVQDGNCK